MSVTLFIGLMIIAAVIHMALGALWYSKFVFGKMWMKAVGKTEEVVKQEMQSRSKLVWSLQLVSSLIVAFFLTAYAAGAPDISLASAAIRGLFSVLVFAAPLAIGSYLFESRSLKAYVIFYAYAAVSVMLQLVVLTAIL